MTRSDWHRKLGYWCEILGVRETPRLVIVEAGKIDGDDARAEFDDRRATYWTIKIRKGSHVDPDLIMAHELLHVRTRLTDAVHEDALWDIAKALVRLKNAKA